jgi:hypothetical protein
MSEGRMLFYGVIFFMSCATVLIGSCTYTGAKCREEALKAGKPTPEIVLLCKRAGE